MEGNQASPHIKDHYKVVGVEPGVVIARDGKTVDLRTISLERAHELHAQKFPYLTPIEPSSKKIVDSEENETFEKEESQTKKEEINNENSVNNSKRTNNPKK